MKQLVSMQGGVPAPKARADAPTVVAPVAALQTEQTTVVQKPAEKKKDAPKADKAALGVAITALVTSDTTVVEGATMTVGYQKTMKILADAGAVENGVTHAKFLPESKYAEVIATLQAAMPGREVA